MRILVVESRAEVSVPLVNHLESLRHCVDFAAVKAVAAYLMTTATFDVIVLSERLGAESGYRVLQQLRSCMRKPVPVLMLGDQTPRDPDADEVPEDYLAPPYTLNTIVGRIGLLRRKKGRSGTVLKVGGISLDLVNRTVQRSGRMIRVDPPLLPMLQAMMEASPKRVTISELSACSANGGVQIAEANVRGRVHSLRDVLDRPFDVQMIRSRRDGFCLLPEEAVPPSKSVERRVSM